MQGLSFCSGPTGGTTRRAYSTINNNIYLYCSDVRGSPDDLPNYYDKYACNRILFFTAIACLISNMVPNDLGLYRVVPITDRNLQRFLREIHSGDDCARITYYY